MSLVLPWFFTASLVLHLVLPAHLAMTATTTYTIMGLFYEFVHYLAHTKVQPKSKVCPTPAYLALWKQTHILVLEHIYENPDEPSPSHIQISCCFDLLQNTRIHIAHTTNDHNPPPPHNTCMQGCTHAHKHTHAHAHTCTHAHERAQTFTRTNTHTAHNHTQTRTKAHAHTHTHTRMHTHSHKLRLSHAHSRKRIYAHAHTRTNVHILIHECTYAHTHTRTHEHHAHTHTLSLKHTCTQQFLRNIKTHHMKHHLIDDRYWHTFSYVANTKIHKYLCIDPYISLFRCISIKICLLMCFYVTYTCTW